ncbi:MAG: hypothetical protein AAGK14_15845 [Verrucomicrobiota bacterium]
MNGANDWSIPPETDDWEGSFEASQRFQWRYFRSLSFEQKLDALEEMCELVEHFQRRREARACQKG